MSRWTKSINIPLAVHFNLSDNSKILFVQRCILSRVLFLSGVMQLSFPVKHSYSSCGSKKVEWSVSTKSFWKILTLYHSLSFPLFSWTVLEQYAYALCVITCSFFVIVLSDNMTSFFRPNWMVWLSWLSFGRCCTALIFYFFSACFRLFYVCVTLQLLMHCFRRLMLALIRDCATKNAMTE